MRLVGLMIARNEGWCVGASARAALEWCDDLIVMQHCCEDDTTAVLDEVQREVGYRLIRMWEDNPDWNEADYRQRMLMSGRALGGTHFAIVDADELLTRNLVYKVRRLAEDLTAGECAKIPWLCLWRSLTRYRSDASPFGRARAPVLVCDAPHLSHRAKEDGYQIHTRVPAGAVVVFKLAHADGGLLHLQHAHWGRLRAKQALYKLQEALRWNVAPHVINAKYNPTVDEYGLVVTPLPPAWSPPQMAYVDLEAVPWQQAECEKLIGKHGAERFKGLDLFEVTGDSGVKRS